MKTLSRQARPTSGNAIVANSVITTPPSRKVLGPNRRNFRQLVLDMYLEGVGLRAIGRLWKVSNTAVLYWIKKAGKSVEVPVESEPVAVVEVDEMHSFVGQKNYRWIWIAVNR